MNNRLRNVLLFLIMLSIALPPLAMGLYRNYGIEGGHPSFLTIQADGATLGNGSDAAQILMKFELGASDITLDYYPAIDFGTGLIKGLLYNCGNSKHCAVGSQSDKNSYLYSTTHSSGKVADYWWMYATSFGSTALGTASAYLMEFDPDAQDFTMYFWQGSAPLTYNPVLTVDGATSGAAYSGEVVINESGLALGLRVETDHLTDSFVVAGATDTVNVNTHMAVGGTTPTINSCGSGATVAGADNAFEVTVGTSAGQTCVVDFARAWGAIPVCVEVLKGLPAAGTYPRIVALTTSSITLSSGTNDIDSEVINVMCMGISR